MCLMLFLNISFVKVLQHAKADSRLMRSIITSIALCLIVPVLNAGEADSQSIRQWYMAAIGDADSAEFFHGKMQELTASETP